MLFFKLKILYLMLQVTLQRTNFQTKQTLGFLSVHGKEICKTLELPWKKNIRRISCIPAGSYSVTKRFSQKYQHHFHIVNVPNRDWILIHHGNFYFDILGCLLVGKSHTDINADGLLDVTASKKTMQLLHNRLPHKFILKIINP